MSTHSTETTRGTDTDPGAQATGRSRVVQLVSDATGLDRGRSALVLAGAALLARAARTAGRNRRRAALQALAGAGLIGVGFRRRLMGSRGEATTGSAADDATDTGVDDPTGTSPSEADDEHEVSVEARAHTERSDVLNQDETNPRGTSGEPDVDTVTDPDEGNVQFTTEPDEEPHPKPDLQDEDAEDPRVNDADDNAVADDVEIDISEAAMADEASEAVGPADEQAYPTQEGTDPEPSAPKAPETHTESTGAKASAGEESDATRDDDRDDERGDEDDGDEDSA
jgi:hypothetical protein